MFTPILKALYFIMTEAVLISKIETTVFSFSTLKVVRAVLGLWLEDCFHEELLLLICDLIPLYFLDYATSICYSPSHRLVALKS